MTVNVEITGNVEFGIFNENTKQYENVLTAGSVVPATRASAAEKEQGIGWRFNSIRIWESDGRECA